MQSFFIRTRRFIGHTVRTLLPRNEHYRPIGTHASSPALATKADSGAQYFGVYSGYTSHLDVPDEFTQLDPATADQIAAQEHVPPAFVLLLAGGRLNVDSRNSVAIIARDNHLVGDVSLQFVAGRMALASPAENPIFRQRYFRPPADIAGTVCSLLFGGAAMAGNYYHWLLDALPRLHLVAEAGLWDAVDYFVIYSREHRFAVETLLALGIRNEQILDVQEVTHLRAEQLLVTSPVRGTGRHTPYWAGEFLKDSFRPVTLAPPQPARFSPYVYLSRRDASFRHVGNEAAVEALLSEYGFESYSLTELSFREKVALFTDARVVIGPVGAGLVNIVFCAPGTALIELLPHNFVAAAYLDLTARLGMLHIPLISPHNATPSHRGTAHHHDDLIVDLDALRQAVRLAMPQPTSETTHEAALEPYKTLDSKLVN